ncbi:MAG: pitrilysin family protein [Acidobacteriota bacterium]|nr:pitrilysin family protein [Acidobacteriota bacterium]
MRPTLPVLMFLCLCLPAAAQNIKYTEFTLSNGLHVILHEDRSKPIVAVTVTYHVGSKDEDPDRTGFAHFFEHLLFEGSKHMGRGDFDRHLQNAGGTNNATTDQDRTLYYETLPSNQLELGLWLESERMLHANILQEGVETQREVVKEERRLRVDNRPYGTMMEETMKRAFQKHPYNWTPIGSLDHINAATLDEFIAFYEKYYVPNNAVLSIAGDLNVRKTKKLVKKYFGDIPRGKEIERKKIQEPMNPGEIRDVIYDNIQLPAVIMTYRIPPRGTPDFYAVDMLMTLLSRGQSSRLNREIKDNQQKALFTGAFPFPMEHTGVSIMFGICSMGVEPEALEAAIEAEVEKVKNTPITEREFQKIRNQMENDFVSANSSLSGIAGSLADYHTFYGDAGLINTELKRYLKVTVEDIQRVAREYLIKENRVVLYYQPKSMQKEGP